MSDPTASDSKRYDKPKRWIALDGLRGLAVLLTLLVNNSFPSYDVLMPSLWDGVSIGDLLQPLFLFVCGCSIALSFEKYCFVQKEHELEQDRGSGDESGRCSSDSMKKKRRDGCSNGSNTPFLINAFFRTVKLFVIGLLIEGARGNIPNYDLRTIRISGVLQQIAICYLVITFVLSVVPKLNVRRGELKVFRKHVYMWIYFFVVIALYLPILYTLDVPNCGRGNTTLTCNSVSYIDQQIMTPLHMMTDDVEPYGLMATLSGSVVTLTGLYYGLVYAQARRKFDKYSINLEFNPGLVRVTTLNSKLARLWIPTSLILVACGSGLHVLGIHIIRSIFSPSYLLLNCGVAGFLLAIFHLLIDHPSKFKFLFQPLIWLGTNPLFIFIGNAVAQTVLGYGPVPTSSALIYYDTTDTNLAHELYALLFSKLHHLSTENANFVWGVLCVVAFTCMSAIMYKKKYSCNV